MPKLIPMTLVALLAFAAPAFAQDGGIPGLDGLKERADELLKKIEDIVQPLLQKLEETMNAIMKEFEGWMENMDPNEMFGEFDLEQWMDQLRRMLPGAPGMEEDDGDEDERFMSPPAPLIC